MSVPYSQVPEDNNGYRFVSELSDFPPAPPAPSAPVEDAEQLQERLKNRRVVFQMDSYFRDAWRMFKSNFCVLLGVQLLWAAIFAGVFFGAWMFVKHVLHFHPHGHHGHHGHHGKDGWHELKSGRFWAMVGVHVAAHWLLCVVLLYPLFISAYNAVFTAIRTDSKLKFCKFWSAYCNRKWDSIKFGTVFFLLSVVLYLLFIIPSVLFIFFTFLSLPLFVDRKSASIGVWKSFKLSKTVIAKYLCSMLGFLLVSALVLFLGAMFFGVGLLVALPVVFFAKCFMYHHLVGIEGVPLIDAGVEVPFSGTSVVPSAAIANSYPAYSARPVYLEAAAPAAPVVASVPQSSSGASYVPIAAPVYPH